MSAPYDYVNGYNADPINRAPSPYHQQSSSNDYYNQHPQQHDAVVHQPQPSPYSEGPTPATEGNETDRGLVGALAGGASGGYVGHQTCHGFLGTVGGAIVGSLTEDWAKKKKPCSRPCSPQPPPVTEVACPPPQPACPPGGYNHHYSPPLVHTQTTMSSHTDVNAGALYGHHQPQHPPYHTPPYHPNNSHPPAPTKPCGHTHTCACKWFGGH